ncbi:MAG: FKBP-type peptidyl-prolyl cis-trans isomerase [Muribaculaceae bacterium]|nr:FKBP-type peptidyl-prolyl cis-trans isomerase [Muribaculaceae bacterium]
MKISKFIPIILISVILILPSCFGDSDVFDYTAWLNRNLEYINNLEKETEGGIPVYDKITPDWDSSIYVLVKWHNDRAETTNLVTPLSTSTILVKYTLTNVDGDTLDSSDSFQCVPNQLVTGFWAAVTNMHVNDTVTAVMPYYAGYGVSGSTAIPPYSTLIFGIRLDSIVKLVAK